MTLSRRHFLKTSTAFALGFSGLHTLIACDRADVPNTQAISERFGPFLPDPDKILDLPKDFSYQIISRKGEQMTDGFFVPESHDGMASVDPDEYIVPEDRVIQIIYLPGSPHISALASQPGRFWTIMFLVMSLVFTIWMVKAVRDVNQGKF